MENDFKMKRMQRNFNVRFEASNLCIEQNYNTNSHNPPKQFSSKPKKGHILPCSLFSNQYKIKISEKIHKSLRSFFYV